MSVLYDIYEGKIMKEINLPNDDLLISLMSSEKELLKNKKYFLKTFWKKIINILKKTKKKRLYKDFHWE